MGSVQWWLLLDRTNKYFQFIEKSRHKKYTEETILHEHHVIPKYWFKEKSKEAISYRDSKQNLIFLSLKDHIKAHELLFEIYQNPQDKAAVAMLFGNKEESVRLWRVLGAKAVHEISKFEKLTFWDKEFQKEMSKRSMQRPDALEIRSKAGKVGGRNRNLNRIIQPTDRYLFYSQKQPVLCIFNCQTGGDVLEILQSFKQSPLKRVTPLLNGSRKSLNGWSCQKINP